MVHALVLAYHAVSHSWPASLAVSPDQLREQIEELLAQGREGATFTEVLRGAAPEKAFAITFDDGFRSVLDLAFPILREYGLPATLFVPTRFVGRPEPMSWPGISKWVGTKHEQELICVSWDELRDLHLAGWEIGSHTKSHASLPQVSDDEELAGELRGSRERLSADLGVRCTSLAYPFGAFDDRVVEAAEAAGYEGAATMQPGPLDPFRFPRVGVYPADVPWRFRTKASSALLRIRGTRVGKLLERQRHALP